MVIDSVINDIAREIKEETNRTVNKAISYLGLELGVITNSGLKLDGFKHEIKEYLALEYLKLNKEYFTTTDSINHSHKIETPEELKPLAPGDRVLVALLKNEFVVVGRVKNA